MSLHSIYSKKSLKYGKRDNCCTLNASEGFSLIEVLVSLGILVIVLSVGFFISLDAYRGYSYRSEVNILTSSLQKARLGAMLNINESLHGVRVETDKVVIFQGESFVDGSPENKVITPSKAISLSGDPALPQEFIFEQLSGSANSTGTIIITGGARETEITINSEGKISW